MSTARNDNFSALAFPPTAMVGSVADFARVMANGTEVPEEFYFAAGLTYLGAFVGNELTLDIGCPVDPRLYTVLLGESYEARKSTAAKKTDEFFSTLKPTGKFWKERFSTLQGCGSAEGLAGYLKKHPNTLLHYDEMQSFVEKAAIKGSTLLQMVTALFERGSWDNQLKSSKASVSLRDVRLSWLGCCTNDTWKAMWGPKALNIGLTNRLFVMNADRKAKVAWPGKPDAATLAAVTQRIQDQLAKLPLALGIDDDAKRAWETWYEALPGDSPHSRRLDTIGLRMLALVAFSTDKERLDVATVRTVTEMMDYELRIRRITDPIDAENTIAQLEENIRRQLHVRGPMTKRELRQRTSADRKGIWAFERALENVKKADDIKLNANDQYEYVEPASAA
jgi:hypothetical protein